MSESVSLLWEKAHDLLTPREREKGRRLLADLQLDRAFRLLCPDPLPRENFLYILAQPLTDVAEIAARRRVLATFRKTPQLPGQLLEHVRWLGMAKNSWDAERSRLLASRRVDPKDKSLVLWTARGLFGVTAHFTRMVMMRLRDMQELLHMFGCVDGWLGRLYSRIGRIAGSPETEALLHLAARVEKELPEAHTYDIEFSLGEAWQMSPVFLRDFQAIRIADKPEKTGKNPFLAWLGFGTRDSGKKTAPEPPPSSSIEEQTALGTIPVDTALDLAARAVQESDRYLTSFLRAVLALFSGLEEELYFYQTALLYEKQMEDRHVLLTEPELLPVTERRMDIRALSDLLLLTESMYADSVVPNDVRYGENGQIFSGVLLTGKNNSGKTVYLRSVGCAVLLAQSGLPIPAAEASFGVRSQVFTVFARGESRPEDMVEHPQTHAGRFEEEAAAMAAVLEQLEDNALVLLNETFQSTAYEEGAEGMAPILAYLSGRGCGFLFVTHLTKLREILRPEPGIRFFHTGETLPERYKIIPE